MSKFTVLIADDEIPARKKMKKMLSQFENLEIIHEAENGLDALEHIQKLNPDIVFLDIEMPGLTGLEVAGNLDKKNMPSLVFATAYNEHAIKAFELHAVDYLLKPFNEERLRDTVDKITAASNKQDGGATQEKISKLEEQKEEFQLPFSTKIPIPTHDRYLLIDYDEVVLIEVEERSTILHTMEKSYTLNQTLDHFEKKLPGDKFLRANRSSLIGLQHVKEIVIWFGNRFKVILQNGGEVIASREKSRILKKVLKF